MDMKIIEVKQSIFADNDVDAERLRQQLKSEGTFLLNVMSSPGSGKTTTLVRTINALSDEFRIGIMEADIDSMWMHGQCQRIPRQRLFRFIPAECVILMRI